MARRQPPASSPRSPRAARSSGERTPRRRPGRPSGRARGPAVREALIEEAGRLFARHGYTAVPLRRIARAAGVTPAMVHYYFGDKQGLYDAMLEHALARVLARVRAVMGGGVARGEELAALLGVMVETLGAEPWIPQLVLREVLSEEGRFRERFVRGYASQLAEMVPGLVRREIAAGRFRADLDPALGFVSLMGMTAFPFAARPVLERVLGLAYDDAFLRRFREHTLRLFLEGAAPRGGGDRPAARTTARTTGETGR